MASKAKTIYLKLKPVIVLLFGLTALSMTGSLVPLVMLFFVNQSGEVFFAAMLSLHVVAVAACTLLYILLSLASVLTLADKNSFYKAVFQDALLPTCFSITFFALISGAFYGRASWGTFWVWDARLTWLLAQTVFLLLSISLTRTSPTGYSRKMSVRSCTIILLGALTLGGTFFNLHISRSDLWDFFMMTGIEDTTGSFQALTIVFCVSFFLYSLAMVLARFRTILLERSHLAIWAREGALFGEL